VLKGSLPDAAYHGTENKNNKKENWGKQNYLQDTSHVVFESRKF